MTSDLAAIYAALMRLSDAIETIAISLPDDEAGTKRMVQNHLIAVSHFLDQIDRGA